MASFPPRVNEKEIGEAQEERERGNGGQAAKGLAPGPGEKRGLGGGSGKSYAKVLEKRGFDAEAQEKRGEARIGAGGGRKRPYDGRRP